MTIEMALAIKDGCTLLSKIVKENLDLHMVCMGEDVGYVRITLVYRVGHALDF